MTGLRIEVRKLVAKALEQRHEAAPEAAAADVEALQRLADALRPKNAYWAEQVDIQQMAATAWITYAEGNPDEALVLMRSAAEREAGTEKHALTPGPLAPARELYGAMLLERGMAREALAAYEAVLAKEQNRLAAYVGAARAAAKAGSADKAKQYTAKVMSLTRGADSQRPEIMALRTTKTASTAPAR